MTSNDHVLQELRKLGPFYYQANPGNLGDQVITQATREFFRRHGLPFQPFCEKALRTGKPFALVYGGGGPFVPYYGMVPGIMRLLGHPLIRQAVILPSSFYQCDEVAGLFDERFTVFCREERSFRYLSGLTRQARVLLADDMAFTLDVRHFMENLPEEILSSQEFREQTALAGKNLHPLKDGRKALLFLRTDAEALPESVKAREKYGTFDLSCLHNGSTEDEARCRFYTALFLSCLDQADVVLTDRLHGAICAHLLGKETWMLENSYGKLSGVYEHTMKGRHAKDRGRVVLLRSPEDFPCREIFSSLRKEGEKAGAIREPEGEGKSAEARKENTQRQRRKILVGICSAQSCADRRHAVRETWLTHPQPDVECLFFLGGEAPKDECGDTVGLAAPDSYNGLPLKVLAFFRYALEHHDFDWLFKCDDDTYLDLSRLPELADDRYGLIGDDLLARRSAPSGGAGYLLSRRIVEKLVSPAFADRVPGSGAEDLIFGKLAQEAGAVPLSTPRLFMSHTRYPTPENDTVSAHWCNPELLRTLEILRYGSPATAYRAEHRHWRDELLFYRNGIFRRRRTYCYGWWSLGADGVLTLRWKMWNPEQLALQGEVFLGSSLRLEPLEGMAALRELAERRDERKDGSGGGKNGREGKKEGAADVAEEKGEKRTEYIHAGCGERFLKDWLNVDLPHYDLTRPLPWKEATVKALFLEHVAECLSPIEMADFLKEAWRVLKPGGVLRMAFTDVGRLAAEAPRAWNRFLRERSGLSPLPGWRLEALIGREGQRSFWSEDSLSGVLNLAGFSVSVHEPGQSDTAELRGLEREEARPESPFELMGRRCLEARKPKEEGML